MLGIYFDIQHRKETLASSSDEGKSIDIAATLLDKKSLSF
jgi:hypothetical protein